MCARLCVCVCVCSSSDIQTSLFRRGFSHLFGPGSNKAPCWHKADTKSMSRGASSLTRETTGARHTLSLSLSLLHAHTHSEPPEPDSHSCPPPPERKGFPGRLRGERRGMLFSWTAHQDVSVRGSHQLTSGQWSKAFISSCLSLLWVRARARSLRREVGFVSAVNAEGV